MPALVPGATLELGEHNYGKDSLYRAFAFKMGGENLSQQSIQSLKKTCERVMVLLDVLNARNQPYNMIVRDHIIHIIPRQIESTMADCSHLGFSPGMI